MKILEKEIALREETRALEQARPALASLDYEEQSAGLAESQGELAQRVADVTHQIRELPDGEVSFAKEIGLLTRVEEVMVEAQGILATPNTGPEAIAAETEAIELLLQAKRINPKGGGGGGSSPGGGGSGDTDQSALALLGAGSEQKAHSQERTVGQATGASGSERPAEFRTGLDAFFSGLEKSRAGGTR